MRFRHPRTEGEQGMTDRPILFSAPMVRAILAGTKTQTRRVVKPAHKAWMDQPVTHQLGEWDKRPLPYGKTGDRLWVRETSRAHELTDKEAEADTFGVIERLGLEVPPCGLDGVVYAADNAFREIENSREASERWMKMNAYRGMQGATVPAIHMPRWASRITLEVTGVRVERLQDISEADAMAEGVHYSLLEKIQAGQDRWARHAYKKLWESIHGPGSWDLNPWVWVVEFKGVAQ
jgi:hypothetical protein